MVVGRVWGETDIATRPLPETMHAPSIIAGATELHDRRPAVIVQPEPLFRTGGRAVGTARKPVDRYPPDVGLGTAGGGRSFCKMGLFETIDGLCAVPLSILSQVVPMRPVVGVPVLGEDWEGIFFERGLCHGLLRMANGGGGNGRNRNVGGLGGSAGGGGNGESIVKIAIFKFPERCGVGVRRVIGEIEVPVEKLEAAEEAAGETAGEAVGEGPIRRAARFVLEGESVYVLDVNRAGPEAAES
jgi:hypothetical protein